MTPRRWAFAAAVLIALVAGGTALGLFLWNERATRDVRGSSVVEFVATDEPGSEEALPDGTDPLPPPPNEPTPATPTEEEVVTEAEEPEPFIWPTYGYDNRRTRFAPGIEHRPPFEQLWLVRGRSLIEFPPAIAYGRLYFGTNLGRFLAVDAETGETVWEQDFGRCIAASPTVADGIVYQPLMHPSPCSNPDRTAPGYLVALDADTGEELWRFEAGVIESSPLLVDGVLYFGSWDHRVYALEAATQRVLWTFETGDEVKAAPAFANGTVFIGSYDGHLYALDAKTGEPVWTSEGQAGLSGAGNFYATPSVAYGRVFVGNTDGKIYSFGARSGDLLWSHSTGGFVYSSAAIWEETIYVGSYDGYLYALDAATGDARWRFAAGGRISGAPTVIAGLVYFSTLEEETYALDAVTGEQAWTFPDGKYTPIVADEERVYLVGHARLYGLAPGQG